LAVRLAVVFLAAEVDVLLRFAAVFFAVVPDVLFFAGEDVRFDVVDFVVLFFAAGDVVAFDVDFLAVPDVPDLFAAVDVPEVLEVDVDFLAAVVPARLVGADAEVVVRAVVVFAAAFFAVAAVTLGIFFAPETYAFRSAPALNFGTAVFFARVRAPVRGFRTMRGGRTTLSKAPKPVMATFSPRATSAVMVSMTCSSARRASALFPWKWRDRASISWLLFTDFPFREPRFCRAHARPLKDANHHRSASALDTPTASTYLCSEPLICRRFRRPCR
jgi:hypothetical protein